MRSREGGTVKASSFSNLFNYFQGGSTVRSMLMLAATLIVLCTTCAGEHWNSTSTMNVTAIKTVEDEEQVGVWSAHHTGLDFREKDIDKISEVRVIADGINELSVSNTAYLTFIQDGHEYRHGFTMFDTVGLSETFDVDLKQRGIIEMNTTDPDDPTVGMITRIQFPDEIDMDEFIRFSSISTPNDLDLDVSEIFTEGDDVYWWDSGYKVDLSDSYKGVTCTWGTEEDVHIDIGEMI